MAIALILVQAIVTLNVFNWNIISTFGCSSQSHYNNYHKENYRQEHNEDSSPGLASSGQYLTENLLSFTKEITGKLANANTTEEKGSGLELRTIKSKSDSFPIKIFDSLTKILNQVTSAIFPKTNFSWVYNAVNENIICKTSLMMCPTNGEIAIDNLSSVMTQDEYHQDVFNKAPTHLQMLHTDQLNDTKALLFPIINLFNRIHEKPCNSGNDSLGEGMCFSSAKCYRLGGQPYDDCTGGKCCIFSKTCGDKINEKRAIFESPLYPKPFYPNQIDSAQMERNQNSHICQIKIEKIKSNICQIYLYFNRFEIRGVDGAVCRRDTFKVKGIHSKLPPICGNNTGQHMYLDIDKEQNEVDLQFTIDASLMEGRRWSIQIKQITCDDKLVQSGCLQSYATESGILQSFNYGDARMKATSGYPPGLNYGICIQKLPDSCSIRFEPRGAFQIDVAATAPGVIPTDFICRNDYLLIPNSRPLLAYHGASFDRFCGTGFPPMLRSRSGPYILQFVSDNSGYMDGGFQIFFVQELC